jgi:ribonuclease G
VSKDLIIDSGSTEVNIALLDDKQLIEIHKEKANSPYVVGDIYLGRVRKIIPGLNAAFVDVGYEKDAFLHYLDLGPQVKALNKFTKNALAGQTGGSSLSQYKGEEDIEKSGKITDVLVQNQQVMVQIAKEPISSKGPRITSEISFAGRYIVLVPFSDRISVSQKIKSAEERSRLKRLILSIKPDNFGVIIRTVAEHKMVAELVADMEELLKRWDAIVQNMKFAKAPVKILGELDRTQTILRDLLNESFNNIHINDASLYEDIKTYIRAIAPDKIDIVRLYKGKLPIFENFGVDKQIKNLFGKKVSLKNGAYLIVEHTEALHVIDVNSGHRLKNSEGQEANALDVNLDAAKEIARQLRLRDMGGIIVIDFIDLHSRENRAQLFDKMEEEMKTDHAKHTVLPPSKFGLVQITRERVRPEMNIEILEKCPACGGTGETKASIIIVDEIENNIRYLLREQNEKALTLHVHPYVHAYITKGLYSLRMKWMLRYKKRIRIKPSNSYHALEYRYFNSKGDEIKM